MRTVAIAGIGLMGGSFALALRQAGFDGSILGVRSRSTDEALARGVIDEAVSLDEACRRADLVYLAQPVKAIVQTLRDISGCVGANCLVTDAGSTKAEICRAAVEYAIPSFLGGHPMAGKESSGVSAADPEIFKGRTYVLTPTNGDVATHRMGLEFLGWIERIGGHIKFLSPDEHDRIVAFTSHLPQVLSSCLGALLAEESFSVNHLTVSGTGLRDTTRLAMSHYAVWADILSTNREGIDHAISKFIDKLNFFRQNLTNPELCEEFDKASRLAVALRHTTGSEGAS